MKNNQKLLPRISVNKGDFALIQDKDKVYLLEVESASKKIVTGTLDKDRSVEPKVVEVSAHSVVANLGAKPLVGKSAYGVSIEPFVKTVDEPHVGSVDFYVKLKKEELSTLKKTLDYCFTSLKKKGYEVKDIDIEFRPKRGRYSGMYKFNPKTNDKIIFRIHSYTENLKYVLFHEFGHHIWYRHLKTKERAKWIKLYNRYTKIENISKELVAELKEDFLDKARADKYFDVKDWYSMVAEEHVDVAKEIIGLIYSTYHMDSDNLHDLIFNQDLDEIESMWPNYKLIDSNFEVILTDYATLNVKEFFAEAVAFHYAGMKVPKTLQKLLKVTVR